MSYTDAQVSSAVSAMEKYRGGETGEVGAALAVVGLSAERTSKEERIRDDMIRVAHPPEPHFASRGSVRPGPQDGDGDCAASGTAGS